MRTGLNAAVAGLALAALSGGAASAQGFLGSDSAYVGVGAGATFQEDLIDDSPPFLTLESDPGWLARGTLGLRWTSGWRLELEGGYGQNDFKVNNPFGGAPATGDVETGSAMVNALRDVDLGWWVKPYFGAGVGALFLTYTANPGTPLVNPALNSESQTIGAYQLIGGFTAPICPRLEGFVDYHYVSTFEHLDGAPDQFRAHEVMVGIRYTFWEAPKPVAAAPPPPPPASKDYVIYFEFNKSNITPAAGAVLDEVKTTVAGKPVSVVGHTDTVGSMKYNQGLSEKRAHSTGKVLVKRGVKVEAESGRSFSEPAVNTGPGVKEPLNRRAVIKVDSGAGM